MPSLDELRNKWFLKFEPEPGSFPPIRRHTGTSVSDYTDGNRITPLIDGAAYMGVWHDAVRKMIGRNGAELYHAGWRLEAVRTLGNSNAASNALKTLVDANESGVQVRIALSRHGGGAASAINRYSSVKLIVQGVRSACLDNRFPPLGSNHHKAICLKDPQNPKALLGSIDISATRWDTDRHASEDSERNPRWGAPTHDTGVQIEGPAVADIERSFVERWNDPTRKLGLEPLDIRQPLITTPVSSPESIGTHSIQALHTYGITSRFYGYSWSPKGEFTAWASYINALRASSSYIYIEDQYFLPFGYPPLFQRDELRREADIVFQLGEAIRRGLRVVVLVPNNAEDSTHIYQKHQRDLGVLYLQSIAAEPESQGRLTVAYLEVDEGPVYVHSKLLICDDEFVLIGSANVGQRSMTFDGELSVGIVDSAETFAKELRMELWAEHLQRPIATLADPIQAYALFESDTWAGRGRVRNYVPDGAQFKPDGHGAVMRNLVDPYAGPPLRSDAV